MANQTPTPMGDLIIRIEDNRTPLSESPVDPHLGFLIDYDGGHLQDYGGGYLYDYTEGGG